MPKSITRCAGEIALRIGPWFHVEPTYDILSDLATVLGLLPVHSAPFAGHGELQFSE